MEHELIEKLVREQGNMFIGEALTLPDNATLRRNFSIPDIRPGLFDMTLEAWLIRIGEWGKLKIMYDDPELNRKYEITKNRFIKQVTDQELIKVFGKWETEVKEVNTVAISRKYIGLDNRKKVEKFIISIDLKPEFKEALKKK